MGLAAHRAQSEPKPDPYSYPIQPPKLMHGVVPAGADAPVLAMDATQYSTADLMYSGGGFPGYPYLAQLATRAEYRAFASKMSTELTRKWIEFTSKQDDATGTADKIKLIEAEFKRLGVRDVVGMAAQHDCYFGRGQIFIDLKGADRNMPLILDKRTVAKGSLERIAPVEAIWTTPSSYNTLDPSAPDFYKPLRWFMLGKEVHASRLMTIITRPLPDMLKPAFNFSGMSLSQLAEPYVDNWLRTRQSVADLINNFSITVLKTAMEQVLQGDDDGADLFKRADLFTAGRSNKGLMLLDKDREELMNVSTSLAGLHELQAQSQEHLCSVSSMPAIVLTGISPSGLNASSEGEIRVFYDWIAAQQEAFWRTPIETILKVVQLSLFGEIDPDIVFSFVPLYQMTPEEEANIRWQNCQTDCAYVDHSILDPSEPRERLAKDPASGYDGLDTSLVPEPPVDPADEGDPAEVEDDPVAAQDGSNDPKNYDDFLGFDGWITVHPNGPDSKGQPAFIGEGGVVEKGMGGKFNGQKISEIHKDFSGPKTPGENKSGGPVDKGGKEVNNLPTSTSQPESKMTTSPKEITVGTQKQIDFANKKRPSALRQVEKMKSGLAEIAPLLESEPLTVDQKAAVAAYTKKIEAFENMANGENAAELLDMEKLTSSPYILGPWLHFNAGAPKSVDRNFAENFAEMLLQN